MLSCKEVASKTEFSPMVDLFIILSTLVRVYNENRQGTRHNYVQLASVAIQHDQKLLLWASETPPEWVRFRSAGSPSQSSKYSWLAMVWNYYWLCRALANKIIIDILDTLSCLQTADPPLFAECEFQHSKSSSILSQAPQEICVNIRSTLRVSEHYSHAVSSNVFFLITILQALSVITDNRAGTDNWLSFTERSLECSRPIRELVIKHL